MKKKFGQKTGIVLLIISALLLSGCKELLNSGRESNIDIYTLDAVDITAKAYPGFNYISWGVPLTSDTEFVIIRNDGKSIKGARAADDTTTTTDDDSEITPEMQQIVNIVNSIMNDTNIDNATKTTLMSYVQSHPDITLTELQAYVATLIGDDNTTSDEEPEIDQAAVELQNYITSFMNNSSIDQGIKMSVSQYMTSHPNTTLAELKAFIKSLQDNSEEENSGTNTENNPNDDQTSGENESGNTSDDDETTLPVSKNDNSYIDYDIKDGVTYTYTIYVYPKSKSSIVTPANSNTNGYSTYYVVKGKSASTSVKAIKPDYITDNGEFITALDLAKYEVGGNKKYILSKENLRFNLENGGLRIAFPTKAYLKYSVDIYKGNSYSLFTPGKVPSADIDSSISSVEFDCNFYKMDSTFSKLITTLSAGTYQAVIKVEGFDPSMPYIPSYIISDPIVIDGIDIDSATSIVDANYIDSGNTIRIVWIPATNSQNRAWATTNYKVYLRGKDNIYTAINSQVKSGKQNGETVYYADYLVSNNTIAYDFYIVLSDNGKVENNNSSPKKVTVSKYGNSLATNVSSVYAYFTSIDADNKINDVYFSCSPSSIPEGVTLTSVKYKIFPKNVNSDTYKYTDKDLLLDSDFASSGVYYVKDLPKDAKIIFQYVLTETGKTDRVCTVSPSGTAQ